MTGRPVPGHSGQSGRSAHAGQIQQASHSAGSRTYSNRAVFIHVSAAGAPFRAGNA